MNRESTSEWQSPNVRRYFFDAIKIELLTPEQEVELAERIQKGDPEARSHMIRANLLLVADIAKDFMGQGVALLDLISEGNIGLMKKVERFDPNKGSKLSTFASWGIRQSMRRAIANQGRDIRLPIHMVDRINKLRHIIMHLTEKYGREPTIIEIHDETGIGRKKIAEMINASRPAVSVDTLKENQGVGDGESDSVMGEKYKWEIVDEAMESPFTLLVKREMRGKVGELLAQLDKRKRRIIEARFGFYGQSPCTLEELSGEFGLTGEAIRVQQNKALKMLRRKFQKLEDPHLKRVRVLKNTPRNERNKIDIPMRINILSKQRLWLMENIDGVSHFRKPAIQQRIIILIDKLIDNPDLTPREFIASLSGEEKKHFNVRDIPYLLDADNTLCTGLNALLKKCPNK